MTDILHDFIEMEFPTYCDIVYVIHYLKDGETVPTPFYVGQSSKHVGRIGDYISAKFSASTDFKVGEAVRYLRTLGFRVVIRYKKSSDRLAEEGRILQTLAPNCRLLLNNLAGYKYNESMGSVSIDI